MSKPRNPSPPRLLFGSLEDQLQATPVRNEKVEIAKSDDGKSLRITLDLKYGKWNFMARLVKARQKKTYLLDGPALAVYQMLDGKTRLADLMAMMMQRYQLTFFESRALTINFLHILLERGLIVVMAPAADD